MASLKRLLIDEFWPDQTTFLRKGRRLGVLHLVLAALSALVLVPAAIYSFHLVEVEAKPRLEVMMEELDSAATETNEATAAEIRNARAWIRESMWLLKFVCYLFLLLIGVVVGWSVSLGVVILRAHRVLTDFGTGHIRPDPGDSKTN